MKIFPSKIDWWLAAIICTAAVVEVGVSVVFLLTIPDSPVYGTALALLCWAVAGFIMWIFFSTHYIIGETDLVARCGPIRWRVPLAAITEVHPSHNPLSSPACSLDRLRVNFEKNGRARFLLISPEDKEGFLHDLAAAVPGLIPDGNRLVLDRPAS